MSKVTKMLTVASVFLIASGCASIKHGAYEKISIDSSPKGALCKMYRKGEGFLKSIATPGEKYIKRSDKDITIVCSKSGFKTATITHSPTNNSDTVGNFSSAGLGLLVDVFNSAHYEHPNKFKITLEKE